MNQGFNTISPSYIPSQSTYPPYTNFTTTQVTPTNQGISSNSPANSQYAEGVFRRNIGKKVSVYFSYPDSVEWRDKVFTGIIEAAGRDHIVMSDPSNGKWYLIKMIYFDYAEFDEPINYHKGIIPNV